MLASLRSAFPSARIDWLVQDSFVDAVAGHPALTGVAPFPRSGLTFRALLGAPGRRRLHDLIGTLRGPRYELVIDAQGLGRSGLLAWWTRSPRRVGYANAREMGWLGVNRRHRVDPAMHAVDRMLALLEHEGITPVRDMRLYTSEADRASIDATVRGTRYAVIAPTSRWEGKRWSADRFVKVIEALLSSGRIDYAVVVASAGERDQCGPILSAQPRLPRLINQLGRTTVGELMALIERSSLVLANDSAALHMAVGFDRPLVGLFGPTRVELVGPYRRERDVIQPVPPRPGVSHKDAAAGRAMMDAISVDMVVRACEARLGG